ncbi:MAG TPA: AMP-binding protein [Thermoanaerobaculia bacterium]|nr:AMP-binding protein [Thermoanaerobaculia bacterium]
MSSEPQPRPEPAAVSPQEVLEIVAAVVRQLQPQRKDLRPSLDASLERDLGLDSLGRVELAQRLERAFGTRLPESALAQADTPRDLLKALAAGGSAGFIFREDLTAPLEAGEAAPDRTRTLLEVLDWHVQRHPDRRHILFYPGDAEPEPLTYGELDRRSRGVAAGLRALGLEPRQTVGLMLPTSLEYFAAFCGVLRAGGIPVPLYPPARKSQIEDHLLRQAGILRTAEARLLVTFSEVLPLARLLRPQVPGLRRVVTVDELSSLASRDADIPEVRGEDIAFLQFTSGSTGNPKGVTLTHANLLANLRAIGKGAELRPDDSAVSWLPLYHDMGLIGSWMAPLYFGLPLILMSPLTFLARPSRWLWAIHRHRATLSPAPNFAYELCTRKIDDAEIEGLDLSSWRFALNGAEPVSPAALDRFIARFSPYGFDARAMSPVYGLAECSLALAFPPLGRGPLVDAVERETFQGGGRAVPAKPGDPHALRFVACGVPLSGHEVRIVDTSGREVGERQEGRLEFRGPSATSGYYRNPEATRKLLRGDWVDSGDRAYIAGGEIYITGRVKDIIIRAGRNLYPQELEEAVGEIPGVRKGCVAVFGSPDPATGTERLVILAETRERDEAVLETLRTAIQERAVDLLGAPAEEVVLAPPHAVPKTSSGKIRRSASRELYESGKIGGRGASVGWQLARLAGAGARAQAGRWLRTAGDVLYAGWFWGIFSLAAPGLWLLLVASPGLARRRRLARRVGRLLAFLTGTRLKGEGLEHAAGPGPRIVTANHQSYLDAFVLTALLPPDFAFVAKTELQRNPVARIFLRRLGTVFVERFEPGQGVEETRKVLEAVRGGESLVIFPEGTFRRGPGLLPFRLGAFVVAAEAGVPVVPVMIRGTRSKLRGSDFFPRRGGAGLTVLPSLRPQGTGLSAAVQLRDAVRAEILDRCGEPDAG